MEMNRPDEAELFRQLEKVLSDPVTDQVLERARLVEAVINQEPDDMEQAKQQIVSLTREWPHTNTTVSVTGDVWYYDPITQAMAYDQCQDEVLWSSGFTMADGRLIDPDNPDEESPYRMCYQFIKQNPESGHPLPAFAQLDKVAIEYSSHSAEAIETRLRYFHPGLIDEIDSRVSRSSSDEESLMRLADFEIDIDNEARGDEDHLLEYVRTYISDVLQLDEELPYRATLEGRAYIVRADGLAQPMDISSPIDGLAKVEGVVFMPGSTDNEWAQQSPILSLDVTILSEKKDGQSKRLYVPVGNFARFQSLRLQG